LLTGPAYAASTATPPDAAGTTIPAETDTSPTSAATIPAGTAETATDPTAPAGTTIPEKTTAGPTSAATIPAGTAETAADPTAPAGTTIPEKTAAGPTSAATIPAGTAETTADPTTPAGTTIPEKTTAGPTSAATIPTGTAIPPEPTGPANVASSSGAAADAASSSISADATDHAAGVDGAADDYRRVGAIAATSEAECRAGEQKRNDQLVGHCYFLETVTAGSDQSLCARPLLSGIADPNCVPWVTQLQRKSAKPASIAGLKISPDPERDRQLKLGNRARPQRSMRSVVVSSLLAVTRRPAYRAQSARVPAPVAGCQIPTRFVL
jgi:hypothetical protein